MAEKRTKLTAVKTKGNVAHIQDVGPIIDFRFDLPPGGGVVVFEGPNSAGKTTALEAMEAHTSGRGKKDLQHRDGATLGVIEGFGASMTVGRRTTQSGELEVTSLEGRFSLLDVVEPGLVNAEAADAKRIKALAQLAYPDKAKPDLFFKLFADQDEFNTLISTKAQEAPDIVSMAGAIKRDCEDHARKIEDDVKKQIAAAEADRAAIDGIDLKEPDDEAKLAEDYDLASEEHTKLKTKFEAEQEASRKAKEASAALAAAQKNQGGVSLAEAETKLASEETEQRNIANQIAELEKQLSDARHQFDLAGERVLAARGAVTAAEAHARTLAEWQAAIDAGEVKFTVTEDQVKEAAEDVKIAREAVQQGAVIREAKKRAATADQHMQQAATLQTKADRLREAGRGTDDVLSEIVSRLGCPLKVKHGRLVTASASKTWKAEEAFDRLGRGDQWTMVIKDIAAPALGKGGVLVIKQEGWEGMDTEHRNIVAKAAREVGLYILTAQWSDEPGLKATVYEPTA